MDALTNTYTDIAKMKLLPDAPQHVQFLDALDQTIMHYIQQQASATVQNPGMTPGAGGMGGMGGGVGNGPMGPSGPGPSPMGIAPGGGGGMSGLMGASQGGGADALRQLIANAPPG